MLSSEDATEISLVENEMRQAMHPADQFEAFKTVIGRSVPGTALDVIGFVALQSPAQGSIPGE